MFVWGECFAYFGSGGDTFDFDIIGCYTNDKICKKFNKILNEEEFGDDEEEYERYIEDRSSNFPEIKLKSIDFSDFESAFSDLLSICVPRLSEDLEKWASHIHQIVPIEFIQGPHGVEYEDDWNDWSNQQLEKALKSIVTYIETRKDVLTEQLPVETESDSDEDFNDETYGEENSHNIKILPESEKIRYFGYIFDSILSRLASETEGKIFTPEERKERFKLIDIIYNLNSTSGDFDRLSVEEHNIHSNAHIITSALNGLSAEERILEIGKLQPYTQLAYFASYDALKANDILQYPNPEVVLQNLIPKIPTYRQPTVTSILSMIGHNLLHITPAYKQPDKTNAGLASKIFETFYKQPNVTEKDYITGTVCCEWTGNPSLGVEISDLGLKKYPISKPLLHNAISVNNLTGNHARSKELLVRYEALIDLPDEKFILNKSFNLIKSQKNKEANALLQQYIDNGGTKSADILVNLFYTYQFCKPEKPVLDKVVKEYSELIKSTASHQTKGLLENFLSMISTFEYYTETVQLIDCLFENNVQLSPSCWVNYTYAGSYLDTEGREKVAATMEKLMPKMEAYFGEYPLSIANLGSIYAALNNVPKTIEALKLCKKYHYPNYGQMRTHEDFKSLFGLKEFEELFR
jgi:hypothetical protein